MFELVLRADEALVEPLTEQLIDELNALSASVEDADAASPQEQALFGEPGLPVPRAAWQRSRVIALFSHEADAQAAAALLVAQHGGSSLQLEALRPLVEQDWVRLTQSQFEPVPITESFWIVPTWHAVPAAAQRAIRLARARASEFGVMPNRIGMMGFSAGGHLTATAGTHFDDGKADAVDPVDEASSRPDFLILGYPVISFDASITHLGSLRNLLGDKPDPKLVEDLSNELRVTPQTPPTFLFHTNADTGVPPENSVRFYLALRRAKVPAEMHIFENGPHGVGLALGDAALSAWPALLTNWLRGRGLLTKPGAM